MTDAGLAEFIEELRRRYAAGEFKDHPPFRLLPEIELGDVERAIGAMLGEADFFRSLGPAERRLWAGPRRLLARKLLALRERLNGIEISPAELERRRRAQPG